jgi:hypothetical protein
LLEQKTAWRNDAKHQSICRGHPASNVIKVLSTKKQLKNVYGRSPGFQVIIICQPSHMMVYAVAVL